MSEMLLPAWLKPLMSSKTNCPAWVDDYRQQHQEALLNAGFPTRKQERWKYTDLSTFMNTPFELSKEHEQQSLTEFVRQHRISEAIALVVLVNGQYSSLLSDTRQLPSHVVVKSLPSAIVQGDRFSLASYQGGDYPFATMNAGLLQDGLLIKVPADCVLAQPIQLLSIVDTTKHGLVQPRCVIEVAENASLRLIDTYYSTQETTYLTNAVTEVTLADSARLSYDKIQNESKQAFHLAHVFIQQERNSQAILCNASFGGAFSRDEVTSHLNSPGAFCRTSGLYCLNRDGQYGDHHVDIRHNAAHTQSEMNYKGILNNKSRAVFNGRLLVAKEAQKVAAYQSNHTILLSSAAEVNSKPELEIYADDVKCKHGATVGQLNEDALFYLRARGIDKLEATKILLRGFASDILANITEQTVRQTAESLLKGSLL